MPGLGRQLVFALGAVWASPMTVAGLLAGGIALPFGARARVLFTTRSGRREIPLSP